MKRRVHQSVADIRCLAILAIILFAHNGFNGVSSAYAAGDAAKTKVAEGLVDRALRAAVEGKADERLKLLQDAVVAAPDFDKAQWHLGQVKVGSKWLSPEDATLALGKNDKFANYLGMREQYDLATKFISVAEPAPTEPSCFRQTFELRAKPTVADVHLCTKADYELFINGKKAGEGRRGFNNSILHVANHLKAGSNVIAIRVKPPGDLTVRILLWGQFKDQALFTLHTNESWKGKSFAGKLWEGATVADKEWPNAIEYVESKPVAEKKAVAEKTIRPTPLAGLATNVALDPIAARTVPEVEKALAKLCQSSSLEAQARFHWSRVLLFQPKDTDAIKALGLIAYDNQFLTAKQLEEMKLRDRETQRAAAKWKGMLEEAKLNSLNANRRTSEGAQQKIASVTDPDAVVVLCDVIKNDTGVANVPFAKAAAKALSQIEGSAAAAALADVAFYHAHPEVTSTVAEYLKRRQVEHYMPRLISRVQAAREITTYKVWQWNDRPVTLRLVTSDIAEAAKMFNNDYKVSNERKEANGDTTADLSGTVTYIKWIGSYVVRQARPDVDAFSSGYQAGDFIPMKSADNKTSESSLDEWLSQQTQIVESMNREIERRNLLLIDLLEDLTNIEVGDEPVAWWNWWRDTDGTVDINNLGRRVTSLAAEVVQSRQVTQSTNRARDGFQAETPVWTRRGLLPISGVIPGDEVLSQHPETGELAYKLVLGVTTAPSSICRKMTADKSEYIATKGARAWVTGTGWRSFKSMQPEDRIHSVDGWTPIEGLVDIENQRANNLIVEDFHTFFVGKQKLLVHDGAPIEPASTVVPGMLRSASGK